MRFDLQRQRVGRGARSESVNDRLRGASDQWKDAHAGFVGKHALLARVTRDDGHFQSRAPHPARCPRGIAPTRSACDRR